MSPYRIFQALNFYILSDNTHCHSAYKIEYDNVVSISIIFINKAWSQPVNMFKST